MAHGFGRHENSLCKESTHSLLSPNTAGWLSHENGLQFLFEGSGHLRYDRPITKNIHFVEAGVYNAIGLVALEQSIRTLQKLGVKIFLITSILL